MSGSLNSNRDMMLPLALASRGFENRRYDPVRQRQVLELERVRKGCIEARHPDRWSLEMIKGLLAHEGHELCAEPAGSGRLMHHHEAPRLSDAFEDGLDV